jgi:hypothetical protein
MNLWRLEIEIDRYKQMEERKIITTTKNELIDDAYMMIIFSGGSTSRRFGSRHPLEKKM